MVSDDSEPIFVMPQLQGTGTRPQVGTVIGGRFRITGTVGAGGMATVYGAEHLRTGAQMAIKILHPQLEGVDEAVRRFEREIAVGSRLAHPNCVGVSEAGRCDSGAYYLAMELMSGETLGDILASDRRLDWRRALRIRRHVLRGLAHVHEHGVVHRDVKPDNILVENVDGDAYFARILDFGVAKIDTPAEHDLIRAGTTIGTPAYRSPEAGGRCRGRALHGSLRRIRRVVRDADGPYAVRRRRCARDIDGPRERARPDV